MERTRGEHLDGVLTRRSLIRSAGTLGAGMVIQSSQKGNAESRTSADVKISSINATLHEVPVAIPVLDRPMKRLIVFVEVKTEGGISGFGLTGEIQAHAVSELINKELSPFLKGKSVLETEARWQEMFLTFNPRYQTGVWSSAVSAIDIALWDIKGKYYGEPVWRLLGGAKQTVPAYITYGFLEFSRQQLVEMARSLISDGHDKLKMVVAIDNGENVREDAARVRAVRDAIGDRTELMIDANYLFSLNRALELAKLVESCNITWFEEPVFGNDVRLLAQFRERCSIPVSAGQNEGSRFRHLELLMGKAIDILQPNVCFVGGYTEAVKVAALAQAFNIPIADGGGWPHHNMHLQAAMANGWRVEFHYAEWKVAEAIYRRVPEPQKGFVTLTEDPGLGLEPRRDVLQKYLIS